jgi:hypothetical protein
MKRSASVLARPSQAAPRVVGSSNHNESRPIVLTPVPVSRLRGVPGLPVVEPRADPARFLRPGLPAKTDSSNREARMGTESERSERPDERDVNERQPDGDPGDPTRAASEEGSGETQDTQQPPQDERSGGYGGSTGGAAPGIVARRRHGT